MRTVSPAILGYGIQFGVKVLQLMFVWTNLFFDSFMNNGI